MTLINNAHRFYFIPQLLLILALQLVSLEKPQALETKLETKLEAKQDVQPKTLPPFRLHLLSEPQSLDLSQQRSGGGQYFLRNIHRTLYKYDNKIGLKPDLAQECKQNNLKVECNLVSAKFNNGEPILAEHFVKSFRRLLHPKTLSLRADLFLNLKNAKKIIEGSLPTEQLGVKALTPKTLLFELEQADPDFLYKLAITIAAPLYSSDFPAAEKSSLFVSSGPYQVAKWQKRKKIILVPNPHFDELYKQRPPIEFYFITEDSTALNLYEKNQLDFLRRLPTALIAKYRHRSDFIESPVSRFDYIGFGPPLKQNAHLRQAISLALNYQDLQKILASPGTPGCPGLPSELMNEVPCQKFDIDKAKKHFTLAGTISQPIILTYSKQGGDDHKKVMEWIQNQLQQNLGLSIRVQSFENKVFLNLLKENPSALFRKGIGLDYLSCYNALNHFSKGSPENFIRLDSEEYTQTLLKLNSAKTDIVKKKYCTQGIRYLIDQALIIPTGRFYFSLLAKPQFTGWTLNELNDLDLTNLRYVP